VTFEKACLENKKAQNLLDRCRPTFQTAAGLCLEPMSGEIKASKI
jgi:hypothetical protein